MAHADTTVLELPVRVRPSRPTPATTITFKEVRTVFGFGTNQSEAAKRDEQKRKAADDRLAAAREAQISDSAKRELRAAEEARRKLE